MGNRLRKEAYSPKEASVLLGKHINTIYRWLQLGILPYRRVRRSILIPRWALEAMLMHDELEELLENAEAEKGK